MHHLNRNRIVWGIAGLLIGVLGAGSLALVRAQTAGGVIHGCVGGGGVLSVAADAGQCPGGSNELDWNQQGPAGPQGPSGVSGYQVVTASSTAVGSGNAIVTASCPAGERVLGGGGASSNGNAQLFASFPTSDASGWTAQWHADVHVTTQLTAYAICAAVAA
ncbi:MAG TPA: hypothetical protein VKV26_06740 [Dehalococcoidia bacterium]|nr:hypothetical protein [Dehalococcoidia bacterium]